MKTNNNDKNKNKYFEEIELIKKSLNNINETPNDSPKIAEIRKLVRTEVIKKEQKQRKALWVFCVLAFALLSLMITFIYQQPILFIKIQFVSLFAIPLAVFKFSKKVDSK